MTTHVRTSSENSATGVGRSIHSLVSSTESPSTSLIPRASSEFSVKHGVTPQSSVLRKLRDIGMVWAFQVLIRGCIVVKADDEDSLFNEMRYGSIPCQIINVISPGSVTRVNEVQSTFSALENLASFTAALVGYGFDRKSTIRPLDFINGTPKGDETMIKNILQLAIMAAEKGFTSQGFDPVQAKQLLESYTNPSSLASKDISSSTPSIAAPPKPKIENSSASLTSLTEESRDNYVLQNQKMMLQRVEALDAGMNRMLRSISDRVDHGSRTTENKLEKMVQTLESLSTRIEKLESAEHDVMSKLDAVMAILNRRNSLKVAISSTGLDNDADSTSSNSRMNQMRSVDTVASPVDGVSDMKKFSLMDKARKRISQEGSLSWKNGAPGLGGSSPALVPSNMTPKAMFPRLPAEIANSGLPKQELMRLSVIYEFIDTEKDFVSDLSTMINYHKKELVATNMLQDSDIETLFSNVEQLIEANTKLLTRLQAKKDANPIVECIGDAIGEVADGLTVYTVYCGNYPVAMKLVHQLQSRPEFKEHMQRLMNSPEGRGLSLESFLIKPVQRICKYPLLMRELLKNTEKGQKDHPLLERAAEKIENVVALVNQATEALDKKEKILAIQSKIESAMPLFLEEKKLLKDGMASRVSSGKPKERYIILFSDILLICKTLAKNRYQLESVVFNGDLSVRTTQDSSTRGLKFFLQYDIGKEKKDTLILSFSSDDEKTKWQDCFSAAFQACANPDQRDPTWGKVNNLFDLARGRAGGSRRGAAGGPNNEKKSGTKRPSNASMLSKGGEPEPDIEMVEIANEIWKRAVSATGHFYFFNTVNKQTTWKLSEPFTILDPTTGKPYPTEEEEAAMAAEQESSYEPEPIEGWPDWRYVDRGDGNPYYFHTQTMETSWYPPGSPENPGNVFFLNSNASSAETSATAQTSAL